MTECSLTNCRAYEKDLDIGSRINNIKGKLNVLSQSAVGIGGLIGEETLLGSLAHMLNELAHEVGSMQDDLK